MIKQSLRASVRRFLPALSVGVPLVLAGSMARAADADLIAPITAAGTTVAAIGVAVFAVHVGVKVYKWARSAT